MKQSKKKYNPVKTLLIVFVTLYINVALVGLGFGWVNRPDDLYVAAGASLVCVVVPIITYSVIKYLKKQNS